VAVVRITADSNKDGRIAPPDDASLVVIDLLRKLEAPAVPALEQARSVDWSPTEDLLVYGGRNSATAGDEDLFTSGLSGKDRTTLVSTPDRDRNLRIDPAGQVAVFERLDSQGRGSLWGLTNGPVAVTPGPTLGGPLSGSEYALGSDSAPDFSPDGRQLVFRRLTGKSGDLETWDLVVRTLTGGAETVIVSGPAFRDAPDWGPDGIAFAESDGAQSRLVIVAPDGSNRRVPVTLPAGSSLSSVRWLAPPASR
jgi:Tol biopolymer transport system component